MSFLAHLADRVLNRPLLITPDKAQVILSVLGGRIGVDAPAPQADRFEGSRVIADEQGRPSRYSDYPIKDGVGIISIVGSLVNRGAWVGASSGLVSYEGIKHQIKDAIANPQVRSVLLDIQSPGGEAIGAFETAAMVRELSAAKQTVAVVNGMAASAGYAIASGAGEIVTTETGVVGSIGVVLLHADYSRWLANEGIKPTLIFAGSHKVDGNPYEPLPDDVRADLQAEVDALYQAFLSTVAKGRGKRMTTERARKTEARTFIGAAAVETGLADRVGSFESALAELTRASSSRAPVGRSTSSKGSKMDETQGAPAAVAGIDKATHDAAVSKATETGRAEGAKAATDRLSAALSAEGIKGDGKRMAAAAALAVKSPGMSAEDVAAFVTENVAPAAEAKAPPADPAASYESERLATAGQSHAGGAKPVSGLHARVTRMVEGMKSSAGA